MASFQKIVRVINSKKSEKLNKQETKTNMDDTEFDKLEDDKEEFDDDDLLGDD